MLGRAGKAQHALSVLAGKQVSIIDSLVSRVSPTSLILVLRSAALKGCTYTSWAGQPVQTKSSSSSPFKRSKAASCSMVAPTEYTLHAYNCDGTTALQDALNQEPLVSSDDSAAYSLAAAKTPLPSFRFGLYCSSLKSEVLGQALLAAEALPSTQTLVQANTARLPDGAVCTAAKQLAGRGRGGNQWESPAGCLMFSVYKCLHMDGLRIPFVQYIVTLAIVRAIREQARLLLQGASVDVRIKWPNDVYCGGLKLAGILCQSAYRSGAFHLTAGVGLNLSNRQPSTCVDAIFEDRAHELGLPPPTAVAPETLLAGILTELEAGLAVLQQQGFEPLQQEYLDSWLHTGQQVTLEEEGSAVQLTVRGLAPSGYLLAEDAAGQPFELHPDGNSLDFFKGLVRRKM